jgi:hypothetical protein
MSSRSITRLGAGLAAVAALAVTAAPAGAGQLKGVFHIAARLLLSDDLSGRGQVEVLHEPILDGL